MCLLVIIPQFQRKGIFIHFCLIEKIKLYW